MPVVRAQGSPRGGREPSVLGEEDCEDGRKMPAVRAVFTERRETALQSEAEDWKHLNSILVT